MKQDFSRAELQRAILKLYDCGFTFAAMSKRMNCHQSTLSKFAHNSIYLSTEMMDAVGQGLNSILDDIRSI